MNIYVGNLPSDTTEKELEETFEGFGEVASAKIIKDKFTGETRGFGFIEMPSDDEAKAAIDSLNGQDFKGKALTVNEARPRQPRRPRTGGFGGNGGGGGGGGFGNRGGGGGGGRRY